MTAPRKKARRMPLLLRQCGGPYKVPHLSSWWSVTCSPRQENCSNWEIKLAGQNWISSSGIHGPFRKPHLLGRRTRLNQWCNFTHPGLQALVPWTAGYLCWIFSGNLLDSQCHALFLPPCFVFFVQVPSLQHHILQCCININYLNVNRGINSKKGKAIKIERCKRKVWRIF